MASKEVNCHMKHRISLLKGLDNDDNKNVRSKVVNKGPFLNKNNNRNKPVNTCLNRLLGAKKDQCICQTQMCIFNLSPTQKKLATNNH